MEVQGFTLAAPHFHRDSPAPGSGRKSHDGSFEIDTRLTQILSHLLTPVTTLRVLGYLVSVALDKHLSSSLGVEVQAQGHDKRDPGPGFAGVRHRMPTDAMPQARLKILEGFLCGLWELVEDIDQVSLCLVSSRNLAWQTESRA